MTGDDGDLIRQTFPVIFAAPSGAGKTTIAHELRARRNDVEFSISATTRPPRPSEQNGVDYYFKTRDEFEAMIDRGELLEWAKVHGDLYGTPRRNLEHARARRHFLLLDIDVQGSRQVKEAVPEAVSIFVLPPSGDELARRLVGRGSEDDAVRRKRLLAARAEIGTAAEFDFVIVNDDLLAAVDSVERIIAAESLRTVRCPSLADHLDTLIRGVDKMLES